MSKQQKGPKVISFADVDFKREKGDQAPSYVPKLFGDGGDRARDCQDEAIADSNDNRPPPKVTNFADKKKEKKRRQRERKNDENKRNSRAVYRDSLNEKHEQDHFQHKPSRRQTRRDLNSQASNTKGKVDKISRKEDDGAQVEVSQLVEKVGKVQVSDKSKFDIIQEKLDKVFAAEKEKTKMDTGKKIQTDNAEKEKRKLDNGKKSKTDKRAPKKRVQANRDSENTKNKGSTKKSMEEEVIDNEVALALKCEKIEKEQDAEVSKLEVAAKLEEKASGRAKFDLAKDSIPILADLIGSFIQIFSVMREKDENKDDKFTLDELKAIKEKVESTSVSLKEARDTASALKEALAQASEDKIARYLEYQEYQQSQSRREHRRGHKKYNKRK